MNMDQRIEYSSEHMLLALDSALEKTKSFRYNDTYRKLLGESFVETARRWEEDIRRRKKDPFTVVVIGDFKRGKSTFINALLGEEVVTTDVTTETVSFNRISYGVHSNTALLPGNRKMQLTDAELRRDELENLFKQLGEPVKQLEIKRPLDILKEITIIDTPGMGDALHDFSDMVKESLLQADAVIYVYNVRYPLSQTEQLFLKSAVLPQKHTSLFLVGNFADTFEDEASFERVREMLKARASGLLPDADIAMVSSLDELCRQMDAPRHNPALASVLMREFAQLRAKLMALIADKKESVLADRMQRLLTAMIAALEVDLAATEQGLNMSRDEAAAALRGMKEMQESSVQRQTEVLLSLQARVEAMKHEAISWMQGFLSRFDTDAGDLAGITTDQLLKYYEFYCVDLLQEAIQTCLNHHQAQLYELMEGMADALGKRLTDQLGIKMACSFRISLDNRIWTKGDTLGLVVSRASNYGILSSMLSLVANGIGGAMRDKEKKRSAPDIVAQIAGKMSGLALSVTDTVSKFYDELGGNAQKLIVEFNAGEMENAQRLIEQSAKAANREDAEKEQALIAVSQAREILREAQSACAG